MKYLLSSLLILPLLLAAAPKKSNKERLQGVFPEHIKCIAVLSPASPPNENGTRKVIAAMERAGLKVKVMPHSFVKKPASVEQRMEAWNLAVNDPEVDMIIATRGGKGANDLLDHIDWKKFKERNIPLMGFSNITYLPSAMMFHNAGRPIAGPNVTRLAGATRATLAHLKAVLAKQSPAPVKLTALKPGDAKGKVYAGHIRMLEGNVKSKYKFIPENRVIFIETVRGNTASVNSSFNELLKAGFFDKAAAVVLCHFTNIKDAENLDAMFEKWAAQLKCPVYKGYPYGHENDNRALDFQMTAVIKDGAVTFVQE